MTVIFQVLKAGVRDQGLFEPVLNNKQTKTPRGYKSFYFLEAETEDQVTFLRSQGGRNSVTFRVQASNF